MPNFFSDVDLVFFFFRCRLSFFGGLWGGGGSMFFFLGVGCVCIRLSYSYSLPYIFRMWMVSLGKG